jgi:hypothetical protein
MLRKLIPTLALLVLVGACDRAAESDLTTTTDSAVSTGSSVTLSTEAPTTETTQPGEPIETTPAGTPVEGEQIQVAGSDDGGEVLWVSIPEADYTDRDLEDFVQRMVDERVTLFELYVVDDPAAVPALRVAEADRTPEEQALVDAHYLVSLTDGNVVTFHGPFSSVDGFVLGS